MKENEDRSKQSKGQEKIFKKLVRLLQVPEGPRIQQQRQNIPKQQRVSKEPFKLQQQFEFQQQQQLSAVQKEVNMVNDTAYLGNLPVFKKFVAGNLKNHFTKWHSLTSDKVILNIVQNGLKLKFTEHIPGNNPL